MFGYIYSHAYIYVQFHQIGVQRLASSAVRGERFLLRAYPPMRAESRILSFKNERILPPGSASAAPGNFVFLTGLSEKDRQKHIRERMTMEVRVLKCTQCGSGQLSFRDGFYVCDYCGTKFAVDDGKHRHSENTPVRNVDEKYSQTQEEDALEDDWEESLEEFSSSFGVELFVILFMGIVRFIAYRLGSL